MIINFKKCFFLILSVIILINFQTPLAANFNDDLREIRGEINRDNLEQAIKLIKKIKISNDSEQEKIDLLFGDIYLKINKINKAEEFYQKTFFTLDEETEAKTFIGLAEVRLAQGKLNDAINYAEQSIQINPGQIRPKLILAIAKTRLGEPEEAIKILNEIEGKYKNAEVALAISDFYSSSDDNEQALEILENFIKRDPKNIKVLDQLATLHLIEGNEKKAIEYKLKVYKYYEFNGNRKKQKQAKSWILSVDPKYFDKPVKAKKEDKKEHEEYEEEEISDYDDNKVTPNYEDFEFAHNKYGSGFIVGNGKYVITNHHVIDGGVRFAVRNGIGKVSNATVLKFTEKYDLAILELEKPYPKKYSIDHKDFVLPSAGEDVVSIGYPNIGLTFQQPTITQGIVSKVFPDEVGVFFTTAATNSGNSGGPIFNLKGELIGVTFAGISKENWLAQTGSIPTDMGWAIKSNMIKKVFKHDKVVPVKRAKYDKASIYEKMLPSVVFVVVK